ncbi:hypothetical protein MMC07_007294 [Pseudocyphellaria aurata]|nr:hypothetical protein [Pseudocyphellaria aurata]
MNRQSRTRPPLSYHDNEPVEDSNTLGSMNFIDATEQGCVCYLIYRVNPSIDKEQPSKEVDEISSRLRELPSDRLFNVYDLLQGLDVVFRTATDIRLLTTRWGTLLYAAMEVYHGNIQGYGNKVDIWSTGVAAFFLQQILRRDTDSAQL